MEKIANYDINKISNNPVVFWFWFITFLYVYSLILFGLSIDTNFVIIKHPFDPMILIIFVFVFIIVEIGSSFSLLKERRKFIKRISTSKINEKNFKDEFEENIYKIVMEISKLIGLKKMPIVCIYKEDLINAVAFGNKRKSMIAFSSGTQILSQDEIEALAAHEIAHIFFGDIKVNYLITDKINNLYISFCMLYEHNRVGLKNQFRIALKHNDSDSLLALFSIPVLFITKIVLFQIALIIRSQRKILLSIYSQSREFRADGVAAIVVGKAKVLSLLNQCRETPIFDKKNLDEQDKNKLKFDKIDTHPPIEDRILEIENEKYIKMALIDR